jgi:hypothetical protein
LRQGGYGSQKIEKRDGEGVLDPDLLAFIRSAIRSVWALELLVLMRERAPASLRRDDVVAELRATPSLVGRLLNELEAAGLITCEGDGCRFAPASPVLDALTADLVKAYRERPVAVVDAIVSSPNDRLKDFADAFRFKEKDK